MNNKLFQTKPTLFLMELLAIGWKWHTFVRKTRSSWLVTKMMNEKWCCVDTVNVWNAAERIEKSLFESFAKVKLYASWYFPVPSSKLFLLLTSKVVEHGTQKYSLFNYSPTFAIPLYWSLAMGPWKSYFFSISYSFHIWKNGNNIIFL